jgi:ferredoxin
VAVDVKVEPLGATLVPDDDESIFHCALRVGYRWPSVCGGVGSCRSCFMVVTDGEELLEPVGPWEEEGLNAIGARPGTSGVVRLACQARVRAGAVGHVVVDKRGVRPAKPAG